MFGLGDPSAAPLPALAEVWGFSHGICQFSAQHAARPGGQTPSPPRLASGFLFSVGFFNLLTSALGKWWVALLCVRAMPGARHCGTWLTTMLLVGKGTVTARCGAFWEGANLGKCGVAQSHSGGSAKDSGNRLARHPRSQGTCPFPQAAARSGAKARRHPEGAEYVRGSGPCPQDRAPAVEGTRP